MTATAQLPGSVTVAGLVSIVIPTFNSAAFACQAVASCLAQTYRPIEVIVVDDGSDDDTGERLRPFVDGTTVRYLRLPHGERSRARNAGIRNARGEFIQFLDADDLLEPAKLETQVGFLRAHPELFGVSCAAGHFGDVEPMFRRYPRPRVGAITRAIVRGNFILINTMLTRRCNVLFDEDLTVLEDWEYWFRASLGGRRFGHIDRRLCLVRRHGANTSKDRRAMLAGELAALSKMAGAGVFANEIRYAMFERMYLLGLRGAWGTFAAAAARDPRKIADGLVFLAKHALRQAGARAGAA